MSLVVKDFEEVFGEFGNVSVESMESFEIGAGIKNFLDVKEDVKNYLKNVSSAITYYDSKCNETTKENCKYIFINTGIVNKGHLVTVAFRKYCGNFIYYYTACEDKIFNAIKRYNREKRDVIAIETDRQKEETKKEDGKQEDDRQVDAETKDIDDIAKEVFDQLLIKNGWDRKKDCSIIKSFLKMMSNKIDRDMENGKAKYIVYNSTSDMIMYNTGLVSIIGNSIIIGQELDKSRKLRKRVIIDSKTDAVNLGFNHEDFCSLSPFTFYENVGDTIFKDTLDQFDIYGKGRIFHIIEDRIDRLPEYARQLPKELLYSRIVYSIETSLKIAEHDTKWIMPIYWYDEDTISYVFPLYINNSFSTGKAEGAIVVGKEGKFWEARTILTLDDAFNDAMCVSRVGEAWLQ